GLFPCLVDLGDAAAKMTQNPPADSLLTVEKMCAICSILFGHAPRMYGQMNNTSLKESEIGAAGALAAALALVLGLAILWSAAIALLAQHEIQFQSNALRVILQASH